MFISYWFFLSSNCFPFPFCVFRAIQKACLQLRYDSDSHQSQGEFTLFTKKQKTPQALINKQRVCGTIFRQNCQRRDFTCFTAKINAEIRLSLISVLFFPKLCTRGIFRSYTANGVQSPNIQESAKIKKRIQIQLEQLLSNRFACAYYANLYVVIPS